uniref:Uncharacterized protein n=1 Tax=Opuntia streptacantha TaxID=393608 RepID=A0A7C9AZ87_OPUST
MACDTNSTGWFPCDTSAVLHFACQKEPDGLPPKNSSSEGSISVYFSWIMHDSSMHALFHRADVFTSIYFLSDLCIPTCFQCPLLILLELANVHTLYRQLTGPAYHFIHITRLQPQWFPLKGSFKVELQHWVHLYYCECSWVRIAAFLDTAHLQ